MVRRIREVWSAVHGNLGSKKRTPRRWLMGRYSIRVYFHVASVIFLMAECPGSWASVGGGISGTVLDQSGAAIPAARVEVVDNDTRIEQATVTNTDGFYAFPALAIGHYEVHVLRTGFQEYRQTGIEIDANSAIRVDITLRVGADTQLVTVKGATIQVETSSTQMGEVIASQGMVSVPLNGRSFTDLLALQPGVVPTQSGENAGYYSTSTVSGELNPGNMSVSGMREAANGFMVNGANVNEGTYNGTAIIPNLDSLAEFRILTNSFDAEYGNYSGGQVNAVTKSGTNQFHGDLFEFLRNTDLDARNFYSPSRGSYIRNEFGATFGGPIRRDKVFFFADYQGNRENIGANEGLIPVPSADERSGNFSGLASQLTGSVNGSNWANILSGELGYTVKPGEPYYTPGCTVSTSCVFPNALIPQSAFSAPVQPLMKYIPASNVPGGFYSTSAYNTLLRDDKGAIRIDGNSRWGLLSAYYFQDDYNLNNPYPQDNLPGGNAISVGRAQLLTVGDTKSFGSSAVNEFRFSYMRDANNFDKAVGEVGPTLSSLGFVEGANTLGMVALYPQFEGVPHISFNNFSIGANTWDTPQENNTFQWIDNYSKVKGTHSLRLGGSYHYDQITTTSLPNEGWSGFNGNETGLDFADFLIGAPAYYYQSEHVPQYDRARYIGIYGQDSWRIRSNLTMNLGLRWEVSEPWWEAHNELELIIPGEQSVVFPGAPRGYLVPGDPGIPSTVAPTRYDNFAPRIGLAYAPSGSGGISERLLGSPGSTSVRASFGKFYTAVENLANNGEAGDAPFGMWYESPVPPLFTTPFVDRATGHSEGQRFPSQIPPVDTSPSHPDSTINWSLFEPITSSPGFFHTNRVPYAENYSLSIQRKLGLNTLMSVSYVGSQGHRLMAAFEANPGNAAVCLSVSQLSEVLSGTPTCGPFGENGVYYPVTGGVINSTRAPLGPAFASNQYYVAATNSNYNALEVTVHHTSGRMAFLGAYTYGKSLDNSSGLNEGDNPYNSELSKSLSAFDTTHNFVFSYSYELPLDKFARGKTWLTRGWMLSGITRFATGLPVFLSESDDNSLMGTVIGGVAVPNVTPGPLDFTNPRSGNPYFNTSLFSPEPLGQLGDANRRYFHGPGINNFDMALLKNLRLTEAKSLQFRVEGFNLFNHAQFQEPNGNITAGPGVFGLVTGANSPRIMQAAIKFLF